MSLDVVRDFERSDDACSMVCMACSPCMRAAGFEPGWGMVTGAAGTGNSGSLPTGAGGAAGANGSNTGAMTAGTGTGTAVTG